jgi:hypothetical protein
MHSVVRLSAYSGCLLHYSLNNDQLNLRLCDRCDTDRMLTRTPTIPTARYGGKIRTLDPILARSLSTRASHLRYDCSTQEGTR